MKGQIPFIGDIISGKGRPYRYLSQTIAAFMTARQRAGLIKEHGFVEVVETRKTFGIATILVCHRAP